MTNSKREDQPHKGRPPSKGMINPWKGRSTLKGKTTLKKDNQPLKGKITPWKGQSIHGLTDQAIPNPNDPSLRDSMRLAWGPPTHLYMEIICTSQPNALPRNQISYIWKSDPEYLGTLLSTKKLSRIKRFESALYHYINHKPYPSWGTLILPSSCTLEFLEILLSLT